MKNLVFFLEGPSEKEMLKGILPNILNSKIEITPYYIVFQGKQDLEKNLRKKLIGWNKPDSAFLVLRDQDSGDCRIIKQDIAKICQESGKTKTLVRIACRELESFYLGDLKAVKKGLNLSNLSSHQNSKKFRNPDSLGNPSEELSKLTNNKYQKVSGSRDISPHLLLDGTNRSHSFGVLVEGIKKLMS